MNEREPRIYPLSAISYKPLFQRGCAPLLHLINRE